MDIFFHFFFFVLFFTFIMESPDSKPDINMRDSYGWTPLHTACNSGSMQVIETLISYGALVNCSNFKGDTPLHYLAKRQVSPTAKCNK